MTTLIGARPLTHHQHAIATPSGNMCRQHVPAAPDYMTPKR
jgi:hypothetical protein